MAVGEAVSGSSTKEKSSVFPSKPNFFNRVIEYLTGKCG